MTAQAVNNIAITEITASHQIKTNQLNASCVECSLHNTCLPQGLGEEEQKYLHSLVRKRRVLRSGQHIFRQGESFDSIYVVRSGAVKNYSISEDGVEQVTGFYAAGDVIGLDGICDTAYQNSAITLDSTSVCQVMFKHLEEINAMVPAMQHLFFRLMSGKIKAEQQMLMVVTKRTAEARLATFLINLSKRFMRLKLSGTTFRLTMNRMDIGNFLGLAIETVCREFTRMQNAGILKVKRREIEILNVDKLYDIAGVRVTGT